MKKLAYKLLFVILSTFPLSLLAQDLTGLWTGELYIDSTKKYLPYEIAISQQKGKLTGYSLIQFQENGVLQTGVRDFTIQQIGSQIIIEDLNLIDNSFSFVPPKNIRKKMVVTLSEKDSTRSLQGSWSTNRTRVFLSATGSVYLQRKSDYKATDLFKKLAELNLSDRLVFNDAQVEELPLMAKIISPPPMLLLPAPQMLPTIKDKPLSPLLIAAATLQPIKRKTQSTNLVAATIHRGAKKSRLSTKGKKVIASKALAAKQQKTAKFSPVSKPFPIAAIVGKPLSPMFRKVDSILDKQTIKTVAAIEKRTISSSQSFFYQSDSLVLNLYDNGYVDGDTVSVLLNGELIFAKQGLSTEPVSKTIHLANYSTDSLLLVMYAENLGSIPPNTGLLVVHDGELVYYVRFSADLQSNAAIIFKRKKKTAL